MNREAYEKHIDVVMEVIDNPSTRLEKNGREFKEDIDTVVQLDNLVRAHEQLDQDKKKHIDEMNFKTAQFEYQKVKDEAERLDRIEKMRNEHFEHDAELEYRKEKDEADRNERLNQMQIDKDQKAAELEANMKLEELREVNRHEEALAMVEAEKHGAAMEVVSTIGNGIFWMATVCIGAYAEREGIISKGILAIGDLFTKRH